MQGSETVITALNNIFAHTLALHQQAHLQEHRFELMGYSFSSWWDKIETESHDCLTHYVLNRIGLLGGTPVPQWAFAIKFSDDVGEAISITLKALQKTHEAYNVACDAAEADDDYVTEKMIWKHLKKLEGWTAKFEARKAQFDKVGETAFLAEYL